MLDFDEDVDNFFFNDTATTEIYTLSLHDALPIFLRHGNAMSIADVGDEQHVRTVAVELEPVVDRKSTRLNSSHSQISYAVFCLKKKKSTRLFLNLHCLGRIPTSICASTS